MLHSCGVELVWLPSYGSAHKYATYRRFLYEEQRGTRTLLVFRGGTFDQQTEMSVQKLNASYRRRGRYSEGTGRTCECTTETWVMQVVATRGERMGRWVATRGGDAWQFAISRNWEMGVSSTKRRRTKSKWPHQRLARCSTLIIPQVHYQRRFP